MRYDIPIYFQSRKKGEYNAVTGDYAADIITETLRYASVTDTGAETIKLVYGALKQGVLTVRIQNHFSESFDSIRIGKTIYRADKVRNLRTKQTFIVSEVQ